MFDLVFKWRSNRNYEVGSTIEKESVTGKLKMKVLSKVSDNDVGGKWLYEMEFVVPEDFE